MRSSVARELLDEISIHTCLQAASRTRAGHNASVFSPLFYLLIHRHFRNRFYSFIAPSSSILFPSEILRSLCQGAVTKARFRLRVSFHARKLDVRGGEVKFSWKLSSCRAKLQHCIIHMICSALPRKSDCICSSRYVHNARGKQLDRTLLSLEICIADRSSWTTSLN